MFEKIKEILEGHVDEKGLLKALILKVVIPALHDMAEKTKTPVDDKAVEALQKLIESK